MVKYLEQEQDSLWQSWKDMHAEFFIHADLFITPPLLHTLIMEFQVYIQNCNHRNGAPVSPCGYFQCSVH